MDPYDEPADLPSPLRPSRGATVALLAIVTVVLAAVIGVLVYALSPLGDPTAGTMPPPGSDRQLIDELVPALDDEAALTRLLPATPPSERARLLMHVDSSPATILTSRSSTRSPRPRSEWYSREPSSQQRD